MHPIAAQPAATQPAATQRSMRGLGRPVPFPLALASLLAMLLASSFAWADPGPSEPSAIAAEAETGAEAAPGAETTARTPDTKPAATAMRIPFDEGEKISYDLIVMGAKAGEGVLQVGKRRKHHGRTVLPLLGTMKSSTFFDNVYQVRDTMASLLIVGRRMFPIHTEFKSERKGVQREYAYEFMPRQGKVTGNRVRIDGEERTEKALDAKAPPYTQDVLSWIYHMRTVDMTKGKKFSFRTHSGNWLYTAKCSVDDVEKIWTKLGHMDAFKVKMNVTRTGDTKFKQNAVVWYSADDDRIPLRITFEFSLGKGEAILTEYVPHAKKKTTAQAE